VQRIDCRNTKSDVRSQLTIRTDMERI